MREIPMPQFHEGLMDKEWYKHDIDQQVKRAAGNPWINTFLKLGMREGLFSEMAGALGKIHDVVVEAAKPNLIARGIIDVRTTEEALERFIKAKKSVAYVGAEGGVVRIAGERYETVDIQTNIFLKDSVEWTREFAEDAKWNVMNRQLEELGRSVAKLETDKILTLYNAIADADLAGGAPAAGGNAVMSWSKLVELWDTVEGEDFTADTCFMRPRSVSQLFTATEFINSQYLPSTGTQLRRGLIGNALTMDIYKSSLVPQDTGETGYNQAFACSKYPAGILLVRRDITTEPWEDPKEGKFGVVAHERIGYGILKSKAVAKMNNIKHAFA